MRRTHVNLAVEDDLSESVVRRLLRDANRGYEVDRVFHQGGFGYLKRTIGNWNAASTWKPFVILTDLDRQACPSALLNDWPPGTKNPNLLLRVAVREVEAWLLADPGQLSRYLTVSRDIFPARPDELANPKEKLIQIAARSRSRKVREAIVPREGSTAKQGPDYNAHLLGFVNDRWHVKAAELNSPSLARTTHRFASFIPA